jgi:putative sigma-54 modulation protein
VIKINITGRHMQVSDDLRNYAESKAGRLERYFDQLREIEVVMENQGDRKSAEMIAHPRKGDRIVGHATHDDQFAAIDLVVDKMYQQLSKAKEKLKDKRKRSERVMNPPEPSDTVPAEEPLETYDEVVDKFSEQFDKTS